MRKYNVLPTLLSTGIMLVLVVGALTGCAPAATPAPTQPPAAPATAAPATVAPATAAPTAVPPTATAAPVNLTFYYPVAVPGPITTIINGYIKEFEAQNPGITVTPVLSGGYPDTLTKIMTTINGGGTPPDLAVCLSTDLYSLVDANAIQPLDDEIAAAGGATFTSDFFPAYLANSSYQNHIWSLPFQRSIPVLYYNADLFKKAGLDPTKGPANYAEMVADAQKLTTPDGKQWGIEISSDGIPYWLFQSFVIGAGSNVFTADNKVTFDTPEVTQSLQDFVDLVNKYKVMPPGIILWANTPNDFENGKAAMIWQSSGALTSILKNSKFNVGVSYTVGDKGYGAPTGGGNIYMLKGIPADHQAAAWKFMQFMTSADIQADWSINTGYIASRQSSYSTLEMTNHIAMTSQAGIPQQGLQYAGPELATHDNAQVQKFLGDAVQAALTGKSSIADALKAAQSQADQLLSQFTQ